MEDKKPQSSQQDAGKQDAKEQKKAKKKELRLKTEFVNTTPPGEKKDMHTPMRDSYDPPAVEAAWYEWWQKKGYFTADNTDTREKFVIVIPPPNVTGSLHMGHALTNSIQDALTRWHRMSGRVALWIPGTDHAGIATQVVVEKKLHREKGLSRHDLGREAFVSEVWKWKEQYGNQIKTQLKRLGSSLDWSREAFTMDEKLSRAVIEAFVRLYDQGLIYRGTRLVNWCSALKTAISDIEVVKKELKERTRMSVPGHGDKKYDFGVLVTFAYPVEDSNEKIIVATTRLETMLGDTAVAVHPDDERYKHLHGKFVKHPFTGRRIPIVTDAVLVDMTFGTGAVKVTPAHDQNDYDCGKRNNLEFINIFDDDGIVNENGGPFKGMKRFDARDAILEALKEKGLYEDMKNNEMVLPTCSRTKDVIEPRLKPQWWVNCQDMANNAVRAVADGRLNLIPDSHVILWNRWLENCKDWCISRQLWWGHRIPAYLVTIEGEPAPNPDLQENYVVGRNYEEAFARAKERHPNVADSKIRLEQDPDVLDTWFSSGLFPFSVFGWPEETPDLKAFYPTSLLETGHDILFFWVARMVMMGMTLTGQLPFKEVFLHAMVRDAHGRKMSKSLGNVLDPIDVTEGIALEDMHKKLKEGNLDPAEVETAIAGQKKDFPNGISECGTDAMRFALCAYTSQGKDINLDINRVLSYRHFCNKIWNATKFALMNLEEGFVPNPSYESTGKEGIMERWILSRLHSAAQTADQGWKSYDLSATTNAIYSFWLYELCDVYLEAIKPLMRSGTPESRRGSQDTLYTCIDFGLKLLHPFMPFVTEELWQRIPRRPNDTAESIMITSYPAPQHTQAWNDEKLEEMVKLTQEIIRSGRSMRNDYGIKPAARVHYYLALQPELIPTFQTGYADVVKVLAYASDVTLLKKGEEEAPEGCAVNIVNQSCEINLLLKGMVDAAAEIKKLQKNLEKAKTQLASLEKRMTAKEYMTKVPENVRKSNDERVEQLKQEIESIKLAITKFEKL